MKVYTHIVNKFLFGRSNKLFIILVSEMGVTMPSICTDTKVGNMSTPDTAELQVVFVLFITVPLFISKLRKHEKQLKINFRPAMYLIMVLRSKTTWLSTKLKRMLVLIYARQLFMKVRRSIEIN